ncbi:intermembrane transport protein PqiB [Aidingimonas halophila]|uniref:Paraquat-inducible protein B n=1 Tax=Aidingimonas halophila TaxID=574349 RepID=A0A1H3GFR5_9GAMM|nr:intermembrane transport protein PqiB [Aidingimonas halophila]GHC33130.1 paraquat-inducible protein B [Aidingimonas halophila]SDY01897.1 paraquat-inducible protein B [Aidingimonas halophila]
MTEDNTPSSDSQRAVKRRQSRLSPIWIVPLVAALIGLWLVYDNIAGRGPQVTLIMDNAEGIEAGNTLIKSRNVEVGRVEDVRLSENMDHTIITARMNPDAERTLVEDSQFWVVKPRIDREGISGLGTVLSGAYIQLQPGSSDIPRDRFEVRDQPPVASSDTEGLRLNLDSQLGNSLRVGDPVTYQGYTVGRVEETEFDAEAREMRHRLFIESPYDVLVTSSTRFWSASGVDLRLDSEGVRVNVESLESLLGGGVTFGIPEDLPTGQPVEENTTFTLYADEDSARQGTFNRYLEYVMLVDGSVRGLSRGAPVEYRGVRVGTVASVPWNFTSPQPDSRSQFSIPVLIRIEPQRLGEDERDRGLQEWNEEFKQMFDMGLRASLKSGNLLTGARYVDLNFQRDLEGEYEPETFEDVTVFPTTSSGFAQIEQQVSDLLEKLNSLEVEPVLHRIDSSLAASENTLEEVQQTSESLRELLDSQETRNMPGNVNATLAEIQRTLDGFSPESAAYQDLTQTMEQLNRLMRDLQPTVRTLREQPNALIFDRREGDDPEPRAPRE